MVSRKANKRKTIKILKIFGVAIAIILVAVIVFLALWFYNRPVDTGVVESQEEVVANEEVEEVVLPEKVDLQPVVDEWVTGVGGNKSVLIYDLKRDEVVGSYNTKESYNTASLYKLFVVYEGYRRVQSGEWEADDQAGVTGYTIAKCLDLAIRESHSPCAETLLGYIGYEELDRIMQMDFGITDSDISHLVSNPEDIMKMMKIFYEHKDITDEGLVAQMKDSFLNQPTTTYNWRQGLPSGFKKANVYNKVGWDYNPDGGYWNVYHDAAIVEFPESDRHLIVVVMTNRVPYQKISQLGSMIEAKF